MSVAAGSGVALGAALMIAVGSGCNQSPGAGASGDDGPTVPWDGSTTSCPVFDGSAIAFGAPACNGCMADQCCNAIGACLGGEAGGGGGGSGECTTVLTCLVACASAALADDSSVAATDAGPADGGDDGPDCVSACVAAHTDDAGQLSASAQAAAAVLDCRDQSCNSAGCY
jgi:hypothetical protein